MWIYYKQCHIEMQENEFCYNLTKNVRKNKSTEKSLKNKKKVWTNEKHRSIMSVTRTILVSKVVESDDQSHFTNL